MSTSGVSSGSLTSLSIITQAYLNVTQSITQGFYNQQIVKVDCKKTGSGISFSENNSLIFFIISFSNKLLIL